ncbi:hypothetical protein, partial [Enterococcus diestrammenae]|uniref:hypothetical protein n=1 Tax=Enterococcus diestrammenae TaxID=1155073 RepID=UPI0022E32D7A
TVALRMRNELLRVVVLAPLTLSLNAQGKRQTDFSFGFCRSSYRQPNSYGAKFHLFRGIKMTV